MTPAKPFGDACRRLEVLPTKDRGVLSDLTFPMVTFWCDLDRGAARSFRSPRPLVIKPAAEPGLARY
jgi:hypothetical protein